jgi:hypothetical protein
MILSRSPHVFSLFLIAAASYFVTPVVESANLQFETRDELKTPERKMLKISKSPKGATKSPKAEETTKSTKKRSEMPSMVPSLSPSTAPSVIPSSSPSEMPSMAPSMTPSTAPSVIPSSSPSQEPFFSIKYFYADNWDTLPAEGLSSLTPYASDNTTHIDYPLTSDEFASSGRTDNVAALFEGYIYLEPSLEEMICVTSDDGSKLYLNDTLVIDNDGLHGMQKKCASIPTEGVYKLDLEYFENGGSSGLTLAFEKIVPPMTWVSVRETEAQQ